MSSIITLQDVTKNYGRARGINQLSFSVAEGEVFGYLGPNGAGKTTTIRILTGLLRPVAGNATIAGLDCWSQAREVHRLIGYLPGDFAFDPALTGGQILTYLAHLRGSIDKHYLNSLIERLEFDPGKRFREYSHGNRQKIGLIQAFMSKPRLLILDEPTSGLDPLNQQEFYKMISEVRADGRTVFLSSHILPEIEHTCDQVGIIREGKLVNVDTVANMKELRQHLLEISFSIPASPDWFRALPGVANIHMDKDGLELRLTVHGNLPEVIQAAAQHNAINIMTHEPTLEEIFLHYYTDAPTPTPAMA
jgi:ABC-2 type transport system ATP-binding protein